MAVTLGGTVALTFAWLWAHRQYADNAYVESLGLMAYFIPILAGLRYTSLKGRSTRVQAIFMLGLTAVVTSITLIAAWLGARI